MNVVVAPNLANENETKDIEFSPAGFRRRWEFIYEMTMRAIEHAPWTGVPRHRQGDAISAYADHISD
jgi:Patatin phospholipase